MLCVERMFSGMVLSRGLYSFISSPFLGPGPPGPQPVRRPRSCGSLVTPLLLLDVTIATYFIIHVIHVRRFLLWQSDEKLLQRSARFYSILLLLLLLLLLL